ncbi:hypothetical protein [Gemmatimonas sp.]|uniref:hypothetical protein n=1 Tax=Gemmatimonas sp. TaxID=1962908 RepID=UPI003567B328
MRLNLTKLTADHPVHTFTCGCKPGATEIDDYLRTSALLEQEAGFSVIWVVIDTEATREVDVIVGFFTLSPVGVRVNPTVTAAVGPPHISSPSVGRWLLGRLGVAVKHQRETSDVTRSRPLEI